MNKKLDNGNLHGKSGNHRETGMARRRGALTRAMICCGLLAGAALSTPGHAHAAEQVIAIGTDNCNTNVAINNAVGQSFQVPSATVLDRIAIWMKPELYYNTSYEVRLYSGEGTGGTLLATSNTLSLAGQDDGEVTGWKDFSFGLSVDLAANQAYTLQLTRLSQYSGAFSYCSNVYSGGKLYWLGTYPETGHDMSFRLYGVPNLLDNGHGNTGDMSGWTITANGGAGWAVTSNQFRTSYGWDKRQQLVDLYAKGQDAASMASAPPIHISERFHSSYCPDYYFLKVELLDGNMNVVDTFDTGTVQLTGSCVWAENWVTVSHTFSGYGPDVRYVRWSDGGKDSEYWAGHYGPVLDDAILVVGSNLLANPAADSNDLSGWTITANGGAGWAATNNQFRTSYGWDRRSQVVDLYALGYDWHHMSGAPPIYITEKSQKTYCPDYYEIKVELLDSNMNVVDTFETGTLQHAGNCAWDGDWESVSYTFTGYGPNVRYVRWSDGGKDSEYWAGHYGPKFDDAVLMVQ